MQIIKDWYKSSASTGANNCVEVRFHTEGVDVRDTKQAGAGPVLQFTPDEWAAFIAGAHQGEFDPLG